MPEMVIDSIRVSLVNYQRVVILRVKGSDRCLPIWVGSAEADSIALRLQDVEVPRPLTHDLLLTAIKSLGATIERIVVSDLADDTFYAKVVLHCNGTVTEVDSRPSDAIALAVRTDAPIYVEDGVLDKAGIKMDPESGQPISIRDDEMRQTPLTEGELERLSAFTDFVDTLNLEDLGKGKQQEKPPDV